MMSCIHWYSHTHAVTEDKIKRSHNPTMQVHKTDLSFYCVKSVHTVQYLHVYQTVRTLSVPGWHTCIPVYSTENIQKVITYTYSYRHRDITWSCRIICTLPVSLELLWFMILKIVQYHTIYIWFTLACATVSVQINKPNSPIWWPHVRCCTSSSLKSEKMTVI